MSKPILCLDWDGVIHSYTSGWKGATVIPDPIVPGAIAFMLGALQHFDVVVHSSRSTAPGGIAAMQSYLRTEGDGAWYETPDGPGLEAVRFVAEKPPAMVGIDDRVLTFTGQWPSIEELKAFQPWNKKEPRESNLLSHARQELDAINFGADDTRVMVDLLDRFIDQWDSGGAVSVASQVFARLLAFQPLAPLTGADDEWVVHDFDDDLYAQNRRCGTVFKRKNGTAYDIASGSHVEVTFPYNPMTRAIEMPVMTL